MSNQLQQGTQAALRSLYAHLSPAVTKFNDIIASRGEGSWVWTSDGKKLLDMTSGIGATSTGHCHPTVVAEVQQQAALITHAQQNIFAGHDKLVELVDRLIGVLPPHLSRIFLCNSGSEAVDNAVKIARAATGRQNIIAFEGGFHGRTMGAMALTSSKTIYRQMFSPLMPGVFVAPYPNCLHCRVRQAYEQKGRGEDSSNTVQGGGSLGARAAPGYHLEPYVAPFDNYYNRCCCDSPLEALQWMLKLQTHPKETAAVIIEPILGEGGFLVPPPGFLKGLRDICNEHGMMMIVDEVQAGVGRTGRWWGHQHFEGAEPDLMIFAKGIASGYPLAGIATRADTFDNLAVGTLGGTYGGNAVACAAAVGTLKAIEEDGMLKNAEDMGLVLMKGLVQLAHKGYPIIDVRGRGLMVGAEFEGHKGCAAEVSKQCSEEGMLLMTAGARENLRFLPPLNISSDEVQLALDKLEVALAKVFGRR